MNSREFLLELVKTKSYSKEESLAAQACLKRMRELDYKYVEIDEVGNVVGANYDYRKDPYADILLYSHLDTVPAFWKVQEIDDGVWGRGAVDAKGSLATYIEAGASSPKNLKVVVVGVVEEEISSSKGTCHLITYLKPKCAVNGEPSNTSGITIAYKGRALIKGISKGKESHAGSNADNPADAFVEYYNRLRELFPKSDKFDSVTINLTHIKYGNLENLNSICEQLEFYIDIRIPPSVDFDKTIEQIKNLAPERVMIEILEANKGSEISQNDKLVRKMVKAIRSVGLEPRYLKKSGSADMNLTNNIGIPTLAYGPGDSKLDHTEKEHLKYADYEKSIDVIKALLREVEHG